MARNNALNFNRLAKYNFKFISIEEIILLEYITAYYQKGNLDIVVPNRIELETGLKRNKIIKATEELTEKGFLSVLVDKSRSHYTLYIDQIIKYLDKLFVRQNKYAMQYYLFVQNPGAFKKSKGKKSTSSIVDTKKERSKTKASSVVVQTSLF